MSRQGCRPCTAARPNRFDPGGGDGVISTRYRGDAPASGLRALGLKRSGGAVSLVALIAGRRRRITVHRRLRRLGDSITLLFWNRRATFWANTTNSTN